MERKWQTRNINNRRNFRTIASPGRAKQIVVIFRVKSNDISISFRFSLRNPRLMFAALAYSFNPLLLLCGEKNVQMALRLAFVCLGTAENSQNSVTVRSLIARAGECLISSETSSRPRDFILILMTSATFPIAQLPVIKTAVKDIPADRFNLVLFDCWLYSVRVST